MAESNPGSRIPATSQRPPNAVLGEDVEDGDEGEPQGEAEELPEEGGGPLVLVLEARVGVEDVARKLLAVVVQDEALEAERQRVVDPRRQHRVHLAVGAAEVVVVVEEDLGVRGALAEVQHLDDEVLLGQERLFSACNLSTFDTLLTLRESLMVAILSPIDLTEMASDEQIRTSSQARLTGSLQKKRPMRPLTF